MLNDPLKDVETREASDALASLEWHLIRVEFQVTVDGDIPECGRLAAVSA
jgi:hypothetical protein